MISYRIRLIRSHPNSTLRYHEQKWLDATTQLLADDPQSLQKFMAGDMTIFNGSQFNRLGGLLALSRFEARDEVFEALRQAMLVRQSTLAMWLCLRFLQKTEK